MRSPTLGSWCFCRIALFGLVVAVGACGVRAASAALPGETKEEMDQRMAWWREAKFGMFIHWGLYAIPAGEWKGKKVPGIGEWIMHHAQIPVEEYAPLQKQFNPVRFNAKEWVAVAKGAGMKYIVITSKHHDGFCLFDSKLTDYDITGTPCKRDVLKELADECHQQGIKICWYHSIMDWRHPEAKGASFPKYVEHMKGQIKELLTNYGEIGVLWFDGEWIGEWTEEQGADLEKFARAIQPKLIVNNRVGKRKRGSPGDFGTPEQEIPATGTPGWDWETCMTLNDTWGFKRDDHNWKSTEDVVRKLVDIVSKGGNFLLNVGPTAEGVIPAPSVERLEAVGRWLAANGESIYGTSASPFARLAWGRATQKPGRLYLHVFTWPQDGKLLVPGLKNPVGRTYLLVDKARALRTSQDESGTVVELPAAAPDPINTVVVLEVEGQVKIEKTAIGPDKDGAYRLHARDADLHGARIQYEHGGGKDNVGFWTDPADYAAWTLRTAGQGAWEVEITYACPDAAQGSRFAVEVAGQKLEGRVAGTGGWTAFKSQKLGPVELKPGRHELAVKALDIKGEGVMNLQQVTLRPVR